MLLISQLFLALWKRRSQIVLIATVLSQAWKTAQELTREYIRYRIREHLKYQVGIIFIQLSAILVAAYLERNHPELIFRLLASTILWSVTLYNLYSFFGKTLPEILRLYKLLRGKVGYTLKHLLQISFFTELMEWNIVFLILCAFLAFTSRTYISISFSYTAPWQELWQLLSSA